MECYRAKIDNGYSHYDLLVRTVILHDIRKISSNGKPFQEWIKDYGVKKEILYTAPCETRKKNTHAKHVHNNKYSRIFWVI